MKTSAINKTMKSALCLLAMAGFVVTTQAQTLLYQWNFDNATGSGATLSVQSAGTGAGGLLTNFNAGTQPSAPAGSGLSGAPSDLGLVQPVYGVTGAGAMVAQLGNMSTISAFTVSSWFNLNASVTNFGAYNTQGAVNPRLLNIGNANNGDGNRLYFALNSATNLQFGVNQATSTGTILGAGAQGQTSLSPFGAIGLSPATFTNTWLFVAASYTTALNGSVNLYVGTQSAAASLAGTLTNVGTILWDAAGDYGYVGNRPSNSNRSLPGTIDDVRLYNGAGDSTFVQGIQGIVPAPEPATLTLLGLGSFVGIMAIRRRRS